MTYTTAVCTVKPPDDGQRNCPKHVEFQSKNKFEKLVYLVAFITRIYHDVQSPERQILGSLFIFVFTAYLTKLQCLAIDLSVKIHRHLRFNNRIIYRRRFSLAWIKVGSFVREHIQALRKT